MSARTDAGSIEIGSAGPRRLARLALTRLRLVSDRVPSKADRCSFGPYGSVSTRILLATVALVIVLVAIPAVLVLGWLLLRGRHQDA